MKVSKKSQKVPRGMKEAVEEPTPRRMPEWLHWSLWFAAIFPVCWRQITTSDCWWNMAVGRWLAEHHTAPNYADFYFTPLKAVVPDIRWTALGNLLLYSCYAIGGDAGLQALSVLCIGAACLLLRRLRSGPMTGWCTALFVVVAFGTYQLQLPRAALFSLPLTALLLWVFSRYRVTRRPLWAWAMAGVVALWGITHGSYLLGCVLSAILLIVDVFEGWREGKLVLWQRARLAASVLFVALLSVSIGNPSAMRMLRRPLEAATGVSLKAKKKPRNPPAEQVRPPEVSASSPSSAPISIPGPAASPDKTARRPAGIKEWLNNLIWPNTPGQVRSADFDSPFDRLDYRPVAVSFMLITLGGIWAGWARRPQFAWIACFGATALLGISYFRMSGYASIGSAALILINSDLRGRVADALSRSHWMGAALAALFAVVVWGTLFAGSLSRFIGNSRHSVAIGKVAVYDDAACQWIMDKHRESRVFTTIVTGSYALHRWQGRKQVFIDGFFEPHAEVVWRDYLRARKEPWHDLLRERYNIELALVEHTRIDWNTLFLNQVDWQPVAIGSGCMVYAHKSVAGTAPPDILFDKDAWSSMPTYYRRAVARNYYGSLLSLAAANRIDAARAVIAATPEGYRRWRRALAPAEATMIPRLDQAFGVNLPAAPPGR